jgi:hypothetical protein
MAAFRGNCSGWFVFDVGAHQGFARLFGYGTVEPMASPTQSVVRKALPLP